MWKQGQPLTGPQKVLYMPPLQMTKSAQKSKGDVRQLQDTVRVFLSYSHTRTRSPSLSCAAGEQPSPNSDYTIRK